MRRILLFVFMLVAFAASALAAKYKIKEIQVKPASEYATYQDFQNIVIAAHACDTEAKILELFDTKKLYEKQIMPVLIVVENRNEFAIRLHHRDIYLISPDGTNIPTIPAPEALLRISLKKPLSSYSTQKQILLQQGVNKQMMMDFEHKDFGEKLVAPLSSDHGVVFFPMPEEDLSGFRLYFPEIVDISTEESLIFFEFPLKSPD